MKRLSVFLAAIMIVSMLAACGNSEDNSGGSGNSEGGGETPEKLVMGFVPSQDSGKIASTAEPLAKKLGETIGKDVEAKTMTSYSSLVEALGNNTVQIGFLPAFGYVLASSKYDMDVILKSKRNGGTTYTAQYIVRADSPVDSLDDLKTHAKDMTWAYSDASSTSGYLYPAAQLMKTFDIDNTTALQNDFFKGVQKTGGHDNTAIAVMNGQADIGTTFDDVRDTMVKDNPKIKDKTKIIGHTAKIPNDTVTVPASLDDELTQKIKKAFLSFNNNEKMIKIMNEVYNWEAIVEAKDSDYDVVRETYNKLGGNISLN
ncbi:phosphate/phosphite/phosphonate ABC transporter substrate-binding protein [Tuberibacillus sp. Marseille-P3662]|uniref:phosphate/phosphite/phosphonate ABC transporter substrate-binding protein n=1 Tax=Tuberibacillus sp. Marseille-P3662 TaxID=1965358 RepID=UPI000A1CB4AF|nr:phosphate/phosphite/phosphonate ABC transporter substrate-binding protein [Tuberibacillus sp. Marseille-P3662]